MYDPADMSLPLLGSGEAASPELEGLSPEAWQRIRAYYLALVSHVDDCAGRILATLKDSGLDRETIVIFTSDHGEFLGDHGRIQKGMPGFDCITRVPFVISFPPEIKSGVIEDTFAEAVDVVPTILDYCGIQVPRAVQGRSLRPLLGGGQQHHRENAFTDFFEPFGQRSCTVRTINHMYHCYSDGRELLFDLEKDPHELMNVSNDPAYSAAVSEMRKIMILRMQRSGFNQKPRTAEY
jgi:arylsulfatase A-like enzyme